MNDIVITGLIMAGAYGVKRLIDKWKADARTRLEEQAGLAEPRDLGSLERRADGTFAPGGQ